MEFSTLLLIILTAGLCLYYFVLRKLSHFERLKIPHVKPIPFLGNMAPFVFGRMSSTENMRRVYDLCPDTKYFGFYEFMTPIYVIRDPDLITTIAVKNFENCCDHRTFFNANVDSMAGMNLFDLKGDYWREMRKFLGPIFTSNKIKIMFELMCECAENFTNFVSTEAGTTGKMYEMKDLLSRYANDTVATCAFGISVNSFKHPDNEIYHLAREAAAFNRKFFKMLINRNFPWLGKFLKLKVFSAKIENFFKEIIINTVKIRNEQGIVRPDMIQLMMEYDKFTFDIDKMTAQAFIFFLAGFESTSTMMCFMTHEIGINPNVQNTLRAEINDILKQTNGKITYETINSMKYLDAVVKETLRLYSITYALDRVCVKEFKLPPATPDGVPITVKPGDSIWFPNFSLQRDAKYYSQPDKFDPDRFLHNKVDNSIFMTFGIGPRSCIAVRLAVIETKIMLFYLLWRCNLKPDVKTKVPIVFDKKKHFISAEDGFWLNLQARKSTVPVVRERSLNKHDIESRDETY